MHNPPFISLDGLDGTGKSTQCRMLAEWLRRQGWEVAECADPGGTAIGDVLRDLLLDHRRDMALPCEALLFMASRAQLVAEFILPALNSGKAVVSDRFLLANVVYQGHAGGLAPADLWRIGRLAVQNREPDLTVVLDLPVSEALTRRRGVADRMESRELAYHERVRAGFLAEAERNSATICVVDARPGVEDLHRMICQKVAHVLESRPRP